MSRGELQIPPPPGTPLKCALAGGLVAELAHSGVYLGGGQVAELTGEGNFAAVTLSGFLNGDVGRWEATPIRTGFRIHAACDRASGRPLGSERAAAVARDLTLECGGQFRWEYDLTTRNCHRFTAMCLGVEGDGVWMLSRLEAAIRQRLNGGREMVWRPVDPCTPGFRYAATPGKHVQHRLLLQAGHAVGRQNLVISPSRR